MTMYGKAPMMKIVVLSGESDPQSYSIQVIDEGRILRTEKAEGLTERDRIVWWLADLYNTPDIELRTDANLQPDLEFKFSEIPSIPVLQEEDATSFFESEQQMVYDRIVQAVSEGINTKRPFIRLFELNGTGVYITSQRATWSSGLNQALDFFLALEDYEKCSTIKRLLKRL